MSRLSRRALLLRWTLPLFIAVFPAMWALSVYVFILIYLGHHHGAPILGIDEASRLYLDKPPRALRVDEAAMLAAMVRAPNRDNPEKRPDIVRARRDAILAVMRERDWIDEKAFHEAKSRALDVARGAIPETPYVGRIVRRILFDDDHFDELPAITFDKSRRWANDVDRHRQEMESALAKLRRWCD